MIRDYFKDGDVELSSLVSPVVFSLVPFASIWFQLLESNFIIEGSGIVLFLNLISGKLCLELKRNQSGVGFKNGFEAIQSYIILSDINNCWPFFHKDEI